MDRKALKLTCLFGVSIFMSLNGVLCSGQDYLTLFRPGTGTIWILKNENGQFSPVYRQGDPGSGIGGYDLRSAQDRVFSFDFDHSKKQDHLALYRPGTGTIWILRRNVNGDFNAVYHEGDPGRGIGGYDLKSSSDRIFAFDYSSSGMLDHLALYRPGTGTIWILRNTEGAFSPVYAQGDPGSGIGGYDLKSGADRVFAFDYDHSGKMDHLVLYRPGTGTVWILRNTNGQFSPVYAQGDPGQGIGGYDLKSPADRMFAFDYDSTGKLDHLVLYRPGTGTMWILKNENGKFRSVYQQGDPGTGIGGYDLKSYADRAFAFDYNRSGKSDHIVLYRPATGTLWILKHENGVFTPVFNQGDPGNGIGGYDLKSSRDRVFSFDFIGKSEVTSTITTNPVIITTTSTATNTTPPPPKTNITTTTSTLAPITTNTTTTTPSPTTTNTTTTTLAPTTTNITTTTPTPTPITTTEAPPTPTPTKIIILELFLIIIILLIFLFFYLRCRHRKRQNSQFKEKLLVNE